MQRFFSGKQEVYLEIAQRYAEYIRIGVLQDGDRLPSVRTAAGELGVNPNTVQKAYAHLESQGLICTLPKKGVFVTYSVAGADSTQQQYKAALEAVRQLQQLGISKALIDKAVEEVFSHD